MAELKRHFRAGRMNKDLDERLVPIGEYRDAQNVEISTSEDSNVGALQNVLGTTLKDGKSYNSSTKALTLWGSSSNSIKDLTSPECIGSYVDNQNNKIYWFIKATGVSAIAEYDEATGVIAPILVDKNNILNFSSDYLITGINTINGLLFWTDNQTEPKKIKISSFKSGSTNFNTHTTFNGVAFTEDDITVIKLSPRSAPTLTMSTSKRTGNGTGTTPTYTLHDFSASGTDPHPTGTERTITFSPAPNYEVGDVITLTSEDISEDLENTYEIKILITELINNAQEIKATIQSIPAEVPNNAVRWTALLDEEEPMFEKKFVRFGYRWKYKDNDYSTFSPFSEIAFLPDEFGYKSTDGYNVGMINNLRKLTINITDSTPSDVDEVDILYKESNNNLVYIVDTLKDGETSYEVKSEIIGKAVESNQILRHWDAVPKKAKAQEISANRLIYGNYYQQYDIVKQNLPEIQTSVKQNAITTIKTPEKSLKSQRTYQMGAVYIDKYGRETPVFSNKQATKTIGKSYANTVNSLSCKLVNNAPSWATHFKYFVKETSNEYYNVALDRFYVAEDGNIWLSFPSSERNKISEDDYLILKKQHDKDVFVASQARYKVLDISNEAPDFIRLKRKSISSSPCRVVGSNSNGTGTAVNPPQVGAKTFQFRGPSDANNPSFSRGFNSDAVIAIKTAGGTTFKYDVVSGGPTGADDNGPSGGKLITVYEVTLAEPIKEEDRAIFTSIGGADGVPEADDLFTIILYEEKLENKAEFYGRFFVKINRDTVFDSNIIQSFPVLDTQFVIERSRAITQDSTNDGTSFLKNSAKQGLSWIDTKAKSSYDKNFHAHPSLGDKSFTLYWSGVDYGLDWQDDATSNKGKKHNQLDTINPLLQSLTEPGTFFQFGSDSGVTGAIYEVTDASIDYQFRRTAKRKDISAKRRAYTVNFRHASTLAGYDDNFNYDDSGDGRISLINIMRKDLDEDNDTLSSINPAIFEVEPKEAVELDLYYEASDAIPVLQPGMKVTGSGIANNTKISYITNADVFELTNNTTSAITNGTLTITSADDVYSFTVTASASNSDATVTLSAGQVHGQLHSLNWFNCYSFGNGVESNRLRDDFNAIVIDKGAKVSTVLDEVYKEENKSNGLIFSGIFNPNSGVNKFNQFVLAESIAKEINPAYGPIQKLHARDTNMIICAENKILNVLVSKDAIFKADGNPQITATNKVLGQIMPLQGEYGISKNPESFVSYDRYMFFTDKARGAVLMISGGGLVNISAQGMSDWFKDNLAASTTLLGTYNQNKGSYNLTLKGTNNYTISFDPKVQGWTSFKSFIPESGCSLNNKYYTFSDADLYIHDSATRNTFYGTHYDSSVNLILNDAAEAIKGFKTLNYEGTKSRAYSYNHDAGNNYANPTSTITSKGWYCESIVTNEQTGGVKEFKEKEGKWFNYIIGDSTSLTNLDTQEFSVQGIGTYSELAGDTAPTNKTVNININNTTSNHNVNLQGSAKELSKAPGTSISESVVLTMKPNTGYAIAAGSFSFTSETSSTVADAMGTATFAQDGDNVNVTVPLSFTMPSGNQTVQVNITGAATALSYSVAGTYDTIEQNTTTGSSANTAYSGTGTYNTTAATVFTKTFTAATGHTFTTRPTAEILNQDDSEVSSYTITDNWSSGATAVTFTVKYVYDVNNPTADQILFTAKAAKTFVDPADKVLGFKASQKNISRRGETRTMTVFGESGAQFKFKRTVDGGTPDYWTGSAFGSDTTLTIPSNGNYNIEVTYPSSNSSKVFVYEVVAVSGSLASPFAGTNPVTINQRADVTFTGQVGTSNLALTPPTNASMPRRTFYATGVPEEGSRNATFEHTYTITSSSTITETRTPLASDFTHYETQPNGWEWEVQSITTAGSGSTSYTLTIVFEIFKYGTADLTPSLALDNFLNAGSGNAGSVLLQLVETDDDITSLTCTNKVIAVGASGNHQINTMTICGDWSGNTSSEVTATISIHPDSSSYVSTLNGSSSAITVNPSFSGTASSNQCGTISNLQVGLTGTVTSSYVVKLNVSLALDNTP